MKTYQIRQMSTEELQNSLTESYETLETSRFQHSVGQLDNFKALANTKKDIAKIKTILKERELNLNTDLKSKK